MTAAIPADPEPSHRARALGSQLAELADRQLYRRRRLCESPQAPLMEVEGRTLLTFCSNDYLGLAADARVIETFTRAAGEFGVGSGASHLINGHSRYHHQLEEALADFTQRPRALLFSTGYMANLGVISALAGRGEQILCDRLNHASLIDGARLSGARPRRYRHADPADLQRLLASARSDKATAMIISDGVFSMDGDLAPVPELARAAKQADAWLLIDDAHGLGVIGADGRGTLAEIEAQATSARDANDTNRKLVVGFGSGDGHGGLGGRTPPGSLEGGIHGVPRGRHPAQNEPKSQRGSVYTLGEQQVPILVGTLGKAFGTFGAFVAGSDALIETLIQRARSYIYTTALPPAVAAASLTSLELMQAEPWRRDHLGQLVRYFRQGAAELGLPLMPSITPIQPLLAGSSARALDWSRRLEARGLLVPAIRPPTVPQGHARLRISFSASHRIEDIDRLLEALAALPTTDHPSTDHPKQGAPAT
ncbi:aminotransferase class I/II-fold pyridoxal phosphate-dependent enzyme [Thiorhodovibrio frisius]|uniref:8-amino-7-oxononanoate synthase n=1 Tax=Thiorhodovibrio frisius TaxID=631362 RepID=H8YXZ3_9GAMM|nr:8-amino-7-oxononanoate synthase [Thiorhodovibrio frisius]EIC23319.1 7-keto-8-aminopelargonate synthetase-like enzyme [Thiorhodovibrio frisius]WPL23601.1 8-amino-7-oxononanoate synthase [Thiorhodovibrio frisius]